MFWGLIMEPQRRYSQVVKQSFHISMAALDISTSGNEHAQIMCTYDGRNYLLCTLKKPDQLQCQLDLNFEAGTEVSFATNGKAHVHLTGYIHEDEEEFLDDEMIDLEGEEEEVEVESPGKKKNKKRQATENGEPASKKQKKNLLEMVSSSKDIEDSSDDEDFVIDALETNDDDDEGEIEEEEEGDSDEDGEEEEEGDEDEAEEEEGESSLSEEEEVSPKKKKQTQNQLNGVEKKGKNQNNKTESAKDSSKAKKRILTGGVMIEDLKEGNGQPAQNGRFVGVYYEGRLKSNNKMFDSALKGKPFEFKLGAGEVIKAWDVGVSGMKIGGKRRITCPPQMAYGTRGSPPTIPPNSTLVFEVELKKVR